MSACHRCGGAVDDATVCTRCHRDAERALGNIPWLTEQLDLTLSRQTRIGPRLATRISDAPLPFNIAAGHARDVLRNILVGWCRLLDDDHRTGLPDDTMPAMSRHLLLHAEKLRHHEAAADFVNEITSQTRRVAATVDLPVNRTTFTIGPCPQPDTTGADCPGEIRAYVPADEHAAAWIGCTECGTRWETWQWERLGRRIMRHTGAA